MRFSSSLWLEAMRSGIEKETGERGRGGFIGGGARVIVAHMYQILVRRRVSVLE